jgi:GAF domain-containing protein
MEYRFVHHWQYEPNEEDEVILDEAVALASNVNESNFLDRAVKFISKHSGTDFVIIGLLTDDSKQIQTCKFMKGDEVLDNFLYPLCGTPCENVLHKKFCYYPDNIIDSFPDDQELKDFKIESYLGSSLLSEDDETIGLVALMDTKRIENAAFAEHLILVLSPALEQELIRIKNSHKFRDIL